MILHLASLLLLQPFLGFVTRLLQALHHCFLVVLAFNRDETSVSQGTQHVSKGFDSAHVHLDVAEGLISCVFTGFDSTTTKNDIMRL